MNRGEGYRGRERERERKRENASRGGAESEGDTEAVSTEPHAGLELTNHEVMT